MTEEKRTAEKAAVIVLILSIVIQIICLGFLWNPQKFRETLQKLLDAMDKGKDKVTGVFKKDPKKDP